MHSILRLLIDSKPRFRYTELHFVLPPLFTQLHHLLQSLATLDGIDICFVMIPAQVIIFRIADERTEPAQLAAPNPNRKLAKFLMFETAEAPQIGKN